MSEIAEMTSDLEDFGKLSEGQLFEFSTGMMLAQRNHSC